LEIARQLLLLQQALEKNLGGKQEIKAKVSSFVDSLTKPMKQLLLLLLLLLEDWP
jgi:hypothetical protein